MSEEEGKRLFTLRQGLALFAILAACLTLLLVDGWQAYAAENDRWSARPPSSPNRFSTGTNFTDVPTDHWAREYIETLYEQGYVAGCSESPRMYCPEEGLTRAEMSVFVDRGLHGGGYLPPEPDTSFFEDVPLLEWFAKWVHVLFEEGLTAGCGVDPPLFCPLRIHTRGEATVFFERIRQGVDFDPPQPEQSVYQDVPLDKWYARWIVAAYEDGLVQACEDDANRGDETFRPEESLTRAEAACLMYMAKQLSPPPPVGDGLWISAEALAILPTSGPAWENLLAAAQGDPGDTSLTVRNQANAHTMAKALVYARTGQESYRAEVVDIVMGLIGTEEGGDPLAVWRRLGSYVIAADLVGLPAEKDAVFRAWLDEMLGKKLDGRSVADTHEIRPNNWGTHAGASRAAAALYLGNQAELDRTAQVFKGWLGDRSAYANFKYGDLSWQCDPENPVGINPKGCTKEGHSIDGVLPDDQRRGGGFKWPPPKENYAWGGLQGAVAQAVILYNAGYDVWSWEDQALLRAVTWLHEQADFPAEGDDRWVPHVINHFYGTNFPAATGIDPGKNVGWTDWTHGAR
jgi:hypothetical protein